MDRVYEFNLMSGLTLNPNRRWRHVATLFRIGHRKIVLHGIFAIMYFYFIAYQRGKLDCRKQFKFQLPYKYTSKAGIGLFSLSLSQLGNTSRADWGHQQCLGKEPLGSKPAWRAMSSSMLPSCWPTTSTADLIRLGNI